MFVSGGIFIPVIVNSSTMQYAFLMYTQQGECPWPAQNSGSQKEESVPSQCFQAQGVAMEKYK